MSVSGGNGLRGLRRRVGSFLALGNLSITARLVLAFAGVAGIAATAHLVVDRAAWVIVQTDAVPPRSNSESRSAPASSNMSSGSPATSTAPLRGALRLYEDAVRRHAEENSKAMAARLTDAESELQRAVASFSKEGVPSDAGRTLAAAIEVHQVSGKTFTTAAHARQRLSARYSTVFARMNARLQESIDRAWKIMGRVVARQSLLRLSAELNDIQQAFAARNVVGAAGNAQALVEQAEQAFAATLLENEKGLRRSQGDEWFEATRADLEQLTNSRRQLLDAETRTVSASQNFSRESAELGRQLTALADAPARPPQVAPAVTPGAVTPGTVTVAVDAKSVPARTTITSTSSEAPHRATVAWLSLLVLAVVAYLCFATIISIVRPVRRLLAAADRLARGERIEPVAPGGIRELNLLGKSFNDMAAQVIAAQSRLETRVAERTYQLRQLAERDPLTGLVNRRQLFVALNAAIERAQARDQHVGVYFLDIDNFKTLNDSLGHAYGDKVLQAIASRLEETADKFGFAARLGGDEFMVVREGAESVEMALSAGGRIVEAFQAPLAVDGRELIVSVSVGASVFPDHERQAEALLRAADAALFQAKALGRSRLVVFTPELLVAASVKFATEQRLRRAIQNGEFELFYQPEVSVQNLEVCLVEALLRWRTPDGHYRAPGEFLAVAEESGLINEISDWVLRTAIAAAARWHRGGWPDARIAINISPRQFLDAGFVERLQATLAEFALPARCLELELTESVLQTGPTTVGTLRRLREIGVAIALDDFGAGFSSMASLEQLPLTRVKLDRSLIARMDSSARSASIARATIGLCSDLGLEVTAEGVERLEQFAMLLNHPVLSLQGFLVCEPVHGDELISALQRLPGHCQELVLLSRELQRGEDRRTGGDEVASASVMRLN